MTAAYIENHPYAAQWLRNLIAAGEITPGEVYERDIKDIRPDELAGYDQVHAFAGIGVWPYALRRAGWPDDRPVWTASCPCQPFSGAGKGDGFADERHLWPYFEYQLRHGKGRHIPLLGEQVASPDGLAWIDLVCDDLEAQAHACWSTDICAASVGAPHIRQRQYFVAAAFEYLFPGAAEELDRIFARLGIERLVDGVGAGLEGHGRHGADRDKPGRIGAQPEDGGIAGGLAISDENGQRPRRIPERSGGQGQVAPLESGPRYGNSLPGPVNGFWSDADWLFCRDGKWRPVEPGTFPLVNGSAFKLGSGSPFEGKNRAEMLRGYGNALDSEQAQAFIEAVMEVLP
ncbi:DNA cytosine methyltransferase [Nisaea sediminum]|uniref:DNA cytosine methyltransferase n=1 Tax=Nisaea sediminum TaxID=2775867 RepID=UPI001866B477|nr:DNA cytosine methyltransferase [Nisaea sediminum]